MSQTSELAMSYAALLLHDDGAPITAESLNKIVAAAGIKVEPFWAGLFARVLADADIKSLFTSASSGGAAAAAPAAAGGDAAAPAAEEKKEEEPEESDDDMGMGLFD